MEHLREYRFERFYDAMQSNDIEFVKRLLVNGSVEPEADHNYAIRWASAKGHAEIVELLLAYSTIDPTANNNYAIRVAAQANNVKIVKMLLADHRIDTTQLLAQHINNNALIDMMIKFGYASTAEVEYYKNLKDDGFI